MAKLKSITYEKPEEIVVEAIPVVEESSGEFIPAEIPVGSTVHRSPPSDVPCGQGAPPGDQISVRKYLLRL